MANATATKATKPGLEHLELEHADGCPATKGDEPARLETWDAARPVSKQYPLGGTVRRTRCLDCGRDAARDMTTPNATHTEDEPDGG